MRDKLAPLLSLALLDPRMRRTRREISKRLRRLSAEERERECINCVVEWLPLTCILKYQIHPSDGNVREAILVAQPFTIAVLYLEHLVGLWTEVEPSRERLVCLRTVVDLLARVEAKQDQPTGAIEDDLVAASLVWYALWSEESGPPFFDSVEGAPFLRSDLYGALGNKGSLGAVVEETRRQRRLGMIASLPQARLLPPRCS
jgi:hypothetical protein